MKIFGRQGKAASFEIFQKFCFDLASFCLIFYCYFVMLSLCCIAGGAKLCFDSVKNLFTFKFDFIAFPLLNEGKLHFRTAKENIGHEIVNEFWFQNWSFSFKILLKPPVEWFQELTVFEFKELQRDVIFFKFQIFKNVQKNFNRFVVLSIVFFRFPFSVDSLFETGLTF